MNISIEVKDLKFKIIYDNDAKPGFESGWGFSCFVELEEENILFDTGWDGNILLSNMKKLRINPEEIDKIALSHAHWDHIGGLNHVLKPHMEVFLPESFSDHMKGEIKSHVDLHEMDKAQKITDKVWTTGEIENSTEEQSLIFETSKGLVVLVGCSHPGVEKILSKSSNFGDLYGIIGGLHEFDKYEALDELGLIVATHCTKNDDEIEELYPESFVDGKAGMEFDLE